MEKIKILVALLDGLPVALAKNVSLILAEAAIVEAGLDEDDIEGERCIERRRAACDLVDDAVMVIKRTQAFCDPKEMAGLEPENKAMLEEHLALAYRQLMEMKAEKHGETLH